MGEIRIVGPGNTRGYPYPVCKKKVYKISSAIYRDGYQDTNPYIVIYHDTVSRGDTHPYNDLLFYLLFNSISVLSG